MNFGQLELLEAYEFKNPSAIALYEGMSNAGENGRLEDYDGFVIPIVRRNVQGDSSP
ncbi:MAG: hypothetical protein R8G66_32385 [Cytophagales bacterium]|nr:hypothetical protein [Cytophagales bacterium]